MLHLYGWFCGWFFVVVKCSSKKILLMEKELILFCFEECTVFLNWSLVLISLRP